jgi:hypothetical protein
VDSAELKWAIPAGASGLAAVGLAINSYVLAQGISIRMNEMEEVDPIIRIGRGFIKIGLAP